MPVVCAYEPLAHAAKPTLVFPKCPRAATQSPAAVERSETVVAPQAHASHSAMLVLLLYEPVTHGRHAAPPYPGMQRQALACTAPSCSVVLLGLQRQQPSNTTHASESAATSPACSLKVATGHKLQEAPGEFQLLPHSQQA